mmetsp:Transcript_27042/g.83016  ORF Transcript_27042/g.83016 Transcript_27042/m.83016 type:complete len:561 (+) Transcript_27042:115-1797(+)
MPPQKKRVVHLLDYGAGNVRSVRNALALLGCEVVDVASAEDVAAAKVLIFPGVGAFGSAVEKLRALGVWEALKEYLGDASRPFLGICIGMQVLFEASDESPGVAGLGVFRGTVGKFDAEKLQAAVPHIGWNVVESSSEIVQSHRFYFVHSFRVRETREPDVRSSLATYGSETFVAAVERRNQCALQFHPEKSADQGLGLLDRFLTRSCGDSSSRGVLSSSSRALHTTNGFPREEKALAKRVICALDVRENDAGDLVVTKGDSYDVREKDASTAKKGAVRNLGKPVELAERYYREGCDEIAILNICAFKGEPVADLPLLDVLRRASTKVFVPLTIGGGVRGYADTVTGAQVSALDVASAYFRAGADKVSIGSDAVHAAQRFLSFTEEADQRRFLEDPENSSISQISKVYGAQAVVVSVDPKRAWTTDGKYVVDHPTARGPNGESRCWYRCTVSGGRKDTDLDAVDLAIASERLGAGEIMLNCIDTDGKNSGFELPLLSLVKQHVSIPVVASSGAGCPQHFLDVFQKTNADAALAAGIFHRKEVPIAAVKQCLHDNHVPVRR